MSYNIRIETAFEVEGQRDTISVMSTCDYHYAPEKQVILYDEKTEDGSVPTRITAVPGCVDIDRDHPEMPNMHMCLGEVVSASIDTPYGSIPTTCTTKRVFSMLDENGGRIELEYVMDIGGAYSENRVSILVSRIK